MHPKTIFLDIDGVLLKHHGSQQANTTERAEILPGVIEKLTEWEKAGHRIILTTSRRRSQKAATIAQLADLGIYYDDIIFGLPRGARCAVNDRKPDSAEDTAIGITVERNAGLSGVTL